MERVTWLSQWARSSAERALVETAVTPIAGVAEGKRACVRGTIAPDGALVQSPLTGTPCVLWALELAEDVGSDLFESARCTGGCSFFVTDASGTARVVPGPAIAFAPLRWTDRSSRIDGTRTADIKRSLAAFGPKLRFRCRRGTIELRESIVVPEGEVKLIAVCTREPDPAAAADVSGGYRDQLPTRAVLSGARRAPLIIGVVPAT